MGILVSLCAALLGSVLVLKRFSMIGDGLSHVGYGALCVAAAAGIAPLKIAIPVVIVAAFFLLRISRNSRINGDSAIALISGTAIAIGVLTEKLAGNVNIDVGSYMFGSIVAVNKSDVIISIVLSAVVLLLYVIMHNGIFSVTFDESFARATSRGVDLYNMILAATVAVVVVIGMKLAGALLISALIIFPAMSAMRVFKSFKSVVICSAVISVICAFAGSIISLVASTPIGSTIVVLDLIVFILFALIGRKG